MPRAKAVLQNEFPYSISARSRNRDWYDLPLNEVWEITSRSLYFCKHAFNLKIHMFTLMSNHFHLVLSTPNSNLPSAMAYFIKQTSLEIQSITGRTNQIYGARYYRSILTQTHDYRNTYKYIYRNPVRAGLCELVEEYPYSTLHGLLGLSRLFIPVEEDELLFNNVSSTLDWLNHLPTMEKDQDMRKALRRAKFRLPNKFQKRNPLEYELY